MPTRLGLAFRLGFVSLFVVGCAGSLETQARMFRHFGEAHRIQSAAIFGRLEDARVAAIQLGDGAAMQGMPDGSDGYVQSLRRAAEAVKNAQAAESLPYLSAQVADQCGACHAAFEGGPAFGVGRVEQATDLAGHMAVHSWAAERMWEALVSRNDEVWAAGAEALSGRPIDTHEFDSMVPAQESAFLLASRAHYLAKSSTEVKGWEERAGLLSRLSATCYECHSLAGVR